MNFRQFETLYWIGRLGSFHAAARHLKTSQPAVSARIREMEQDLGVVLFDRSERRVRATPRGVQLLEYAARLMDVAAEIRAAVGTSDALAGRVRLGATAIGGLTWVRHVIAALKETHPGLVLELTIDASDALRAQLERGQLDVAVIAGPIHSARLTAEFVDVVRMDWLASPDLGLPRGPLTATELARWPIISEAAGTKLHAVVTEWFRAEGVEPRCNHACTSLPTRIQLAVRGLGVAVAAPSAAARELAQGSLVRVPTTRPLDGLDYFLALGDAHAPPPLVRLVADTIKRLIAAEAGLDAYYAAATATDR